MENLRDIVIALQDKPLLLIIIIVVILICVIIMTKSNVLISKNVIKNNKVEGNMTVNFDGNSNEKRNKDGK